MLEDKILKVLLSQVRNILNINWNGDIYASEFSFSSLMQGESEGLGSFNGGTGAF